MVLAMFMRKTPTTRTRERERLCVHRMHERVSGAIRLLREYDSKKLPGVRFKCE
jgi:hypothetical protein